MRNGIYDGSKSRSYLKNQNLISFFKKMVCNLQQASDSLETFAEKTYDVYVLFERGGTTGVNV